MTLVRLRVSGPGKPDAEIGFGPGLTLITGRSDTGKTHILECVDFALGSGSLPKEIPERDGYDEVSLEIAHESSSYVVSRRISAPTQATRFEGTLEDWDGESGEPLPVSIKDATDARDTLSGWLLELSDFDLDAPVIRNSEGKNQRLSFRTFAHMAIVDEEAIITSGSPVLSSLGIDHTANRSIFSILLTGKAPTKEEVEALQDAHEQKKQAGERLKVLDPMIDDLRAEIEAGEPTRTQLEAELARLEEELAEVSETVTKSGERARALMGERNRILVAGEEAKREAVSNRELQARFKLLRQHYSSDISRLEFVMEGGHFFHQIAASHCPTCGRAIEVGNDPDCHPEAAEYVEIEQAARAEIEKLTPRLDDLEVAIKEASERELEAAGQAQSASDRAAAFDREIEEVANPSAKAARGRVATITTRRHALEEQLLRYRELDRYLAARQDADVVLHEGAERYRPGRDAEALNALAKSIESLLLSWTFPVKTDVRFDLDTDDIVIDGKKRQAFGKGVRAVTHSAFTFGLMLYCLEKDTPHPGFAILDSPLTPYKGSSEEISDPELPASVKPGLLRSMASQAADVQAIVIDNIDPPAGLADQAVVHEFLGPGAAGRAGFYPIPTESD
jgi:hypothetical protein